MAVITATAHVAAHPRRTAPPSLDCWLFWRTTALHRWMRLSLQRTGSADWPDCPAAN